MLKYGHIVLHMCRIGIGVHIAWLAELREITIVEDSKLERTTELSGLVASARAFLLELNAASWESP